MKDKNINLNSYFEDIENNLKISKKNKIISENSDIKYSIMIIDDNDELRNSFREIFQEEYNIKDFENSFDAIKFYEKNFEEIYTIILDIKMEKMDGLTAYSKLKEINPNIPIIFNTAFPGDYNSIDIIQSLHPFSYIIKGSELKILEDNIKSAVEHYKIILENINLNKAKLKAERQALIGRMASSIVHDIRNPLTIINGYSDMISQIYPETTKFTEIISKSVNDILTMINEILNFIKGKTVINIESVDIKKFISQIVKDLNFQIQDKQKNLKLKYSVDFEEDINFDAVQIRRVIYNIAFNAIDLLPENGTLGLKIFKNENFMEMEISNNGPKIPDKIKKNIFEPFFTYKKSEGTGLGLAVAKKIIKDHEGKIFVKSSNDNLTVFSFLIPIR